jgi:hypothetical protein
MERAKGQTATTNINSTMGAKNNQAVLTLAFMLSALWLTSACV